jgi:uncharacterized protein
MSFYLVLPCLFCLGLVTGFVGTSTGGSSLVTIPVMIFLGVSPQSAVATARVASVGSLAAGLHRFHKSGKVDYRAALPAALLGVVGAFMGATLLLRVSDAFLTKAVGILTLCLFALSLIPRWRPASEQPPPSRFKRSVGYLLFLLAGLLGGFFGGQAIIATFIFSIFFHKSISESIGTRKVSGLAISLAAIAIYGLNATINWPFSLALITGTLVGSSLGSAYALKKGDRWMSLAFNTVAVLAAIKMVFTLAT